MPKYIEEQKKRSKAIEGSNTGNQWANIATGMIGLPMVATTICSLMVKNDLKSKSKDVLGGQKADSLSSNAMTDTSVPKFKD